MTEAEFEKIKISCADNSGKISSNSNFTCWGYFKLDGEIYTFRTNKNGNMNLELVTREMLTKKTKKVDEVMTLSCKTVAPDDDFDIHQEDGPVIMWGGE